jgi:hypothetical protein
MIRSTLAFAALSCLVLAAPGAARASEADGHPISPSCDTPKQVATSMDMSTTITMKNDGKWCYPTIYVGAVSKPPAHGTVELGRSSNGYPVFYYKPNPGYTGKDAFGISFTAARNGRPGTGDISINVTP